MILWTNLPFQFQPINRKDEVRKDFDAFERDC